MLPDIGDKNQQRLHRLRRAAAKRICARTSTHCTEHKCRQSSQRQTIIDIYHFSVWYIFAINIIMCFGSYWRTLYALAAAALLSLLRTLRPPMNVTGVGGGEVCGRPSNVLLFPSIDMSVCWGVQLWNGHDFISSHRPTIFPTHYHKTHIKNY